MYQIYTFPACGKCIKLKEELNSRDIRYEEISAGLRGERERLKEFTKKYHRQLKRDDSGFMILPLVVSADGKEERIKIFQGEDCLENILKNENKGI